MFMFLDGSISLLVYNNGKMFGEKLIIVLNKCKVSNKNKLLKKKKTIKKLLNKIDK